MICQRDKFYFSNSRCSYCSDAKFILSDKVNLIDMISGMYFNNKSSFKDMMAIYRHWKMFGEIPCKYCLE